MKITVEESLRRTAEAEARKLWRVTRVVSKGDYYYAVLPEHPNSTDWGYVLWHRVIMENHLGRLLTPEEVVHHINGDKKDNRLENLELLDKKEHSARHMRTGRKMVELKCPGCGKVFVRKFGNTHLVPSRKGLGFTSCSQKCRSKIVREIQLSRETEEIGTAISENVVRIFKE